MINSITDFARAILDEKLNEIEECLINTTHPGTVGEMFEGLTSDLVSSVFNSVSDIHVCNGFIKIIGVGWFLYKQMLLFFLANANQFLKQTKRLLTLIMSSYLLKLRRLFI